MQVHTGRLQLYNSKQWKSKQAVQEARDVTWLQLTQGLWPAKRLHDAGLLQTWRGKDKHQHVAALQQMIDRYDVDSDTLLLRPNMSLDPGPKGAHALCCCC